MERRSLAKGPVAASLVAGALLVRASQSAFTCASQKSLRGAGPSSSNHAQPAVAPLSASVEGTSTWGTAASASCGAVAVALAIRSGRTKQQSPQRVVKCKAEGQASAAAGDTMLAEAEGFEGKTLADLEELYIEALWSYYREGKPMLQDQEFDKLKAQLYKMESKFPTLKRTEAAFVKASIAYYQGTPVMGDEEYEALKSEVKKSGRRKDVTAFVLYAKGQQLLSADQFNSMKSEFEKLGIQAVNLEECTLAQMEEMYVDALWAYYRDGVQLLTDEQYDKLKQELNWQASGFPTLSRVEIDFVKASLAYWKGEPLLSDSEWKELKKKVLADGRRREVTAFLLYSKGQDVLDAETFDKMREDMERLGVKVKKADSRALDQTLSVTNVNLRNDLIEVFFMLAALGFLPFLICSVLVWGVGIFLDFEFVPNPSWQSLLSIEAIPLFLGATVLAQFVTLRMLTFLDLQNPRILKGQCPSCQAEVKIFSGGASPPEAVEYSCPSCGCEMTLDTRAGKIVQAGLGSQVQSSVKAGIWQKAWNGLKEQASRVRLALSRP